MRYNFFERTLAVKLFVFVSALPILMCFAFYELVSDKDWAFITGLVALATYLAFLGNSELNNALRRRFPALGKGVVRAILIGFFGMMLGAINVDILESARKDYWYGIFILCMFIIISAMAVTVFFPVNSDGDDSQSDNLR